jgi:hypothetical protein
MSDIISAASNLENDARTVYQKRITCHVGLCRIQQFNPINAVQFVFPLAEALPVSWIEAMALIKPIVA